MTQMVKILPAMWETHIQSLGWEDPLEKEMATQSSILVWRIPWTEKRGRLCGPWDSRGKNNGVGCHSLLQGTLLTLGSNLGLLHCGEYLLSDPPGNIFSLDLKSNMCGSLSVYSTLCAGLYVMSFVQYHSVLQNVMIYL